MLLLWVFSPEDGDSMFSQASVSTYVSTRRHNPEELHCHPQRLQNFKSHIITASRIIDYPFRNLHNHITDKFTAQTFYYTCESLKPGYIPEVFTSFRVWIWKNKPTYHQGWRQYAPLKRRSTIILHGSTSQKTILNITLAAVRTWNLTMSNIYLK
jgi:hypothetical protein